MNQKKLWPHTRCRGVYVCASERKSEQVGTFSEKYRFFNNSKTKNGLHRRAERTMEYKTPQNYSRFCVNMKKTRIWAVRM